MIDPVSLVISGIALAISAITLWITLLRRGRLRMTTPNVVFFGYDFVPRTTPKIFLRTLLYSTSVQGLVIESMYARLSNAKGTETFSFWGYGETNNLVPGSGLFVGKSGIAVNHHFVLSVDKPPYEFDPGDYTIDIYARTVGQKTPEKLSTLSLTLSSDLAAALSENDGVLFELDPETQTYREHTRDNPEPPPAILRQ